MNNSYMCKYLYWYLKRYLNLIIISINKIYHVILTIDIKKMIEHR